MRGRGGGRVAGRGGGGEGDCASDISVKMALCNYSQVVTQSCESSLQVLFQAGGCHMVAV
jgi:hypothetical protein